MYFITNSEDYIVAASKSFLDKIGYRDICNISLALKNKEITVVEDNELKVSTVDTPFKFNLVELHSALGKLNLYQLNIKTQNIDDENIAYLRKIKDGLIETKDNEFNIPTIKKDNQEVAKVDTKPLEQETKEVTLQSVKTEVIQQDTKEDKEPTKESVTEVTTKPATKVEDTLTKQDKVKESIKPKEYASATEVANETKPKESELEVVKIFGNRDEQESETKIEIKEYTKSHVEEKVETPAAKETQESATLKSEDEPKAQEETTKEALLKIIDSKEESETKVEIKDIDTLDAKEDTTQDTAVETLEKLIELDTHEEEAPKESKSGLSKFKSKLFPWGNKEEEIELEEETNTIKTANELKNVIENSTNDTTIDPTKEVTVEELNTTPDTTLEDKELLALKEMQSAKEDIQNQTTKPEVAKVETKESTNLNSATAYKLIGLQVDNIDIEENAKKLSIDKDNYKLLLENYLDEIDNYKKDLESGNKSTIDMLTDASNLLSLDLITNKIKELTNSDKRASSLKEVTLITTLIREKLEGKESANYLEEEILKTTQIEEVEKKVDIEPELPQEAISISNADELLKVIKQESVAFDPQRAASDLNLPKTLIIEFVNDFVKQSKEHLGQLVNAFKNDDIKTLQTTAHMLKGAASNLRLDTIADNLFKIQKENSVDRSGELIKEFVAKLKGLESEVKNIESLNNED